LVSTGSTGGLIPFDLPDRLLAFRDRDETWQPWLDALPRLVHDVVKEWELAYDGAPLHGFAALVVPVRTTSGQPGVVKFAWPHDEEEHEHVGLELLRGNGMVRLHRADPRRHVMLLERLHAGEDLRSVPVDEACEVVAGLYGRIHVPAPPQLRPLTDYITRWTDDLERLPRDAPIPHRLVEQAVSLSRDLETDPGSVGTMIHGDLHYENVLAADREPWLAIDPKPMSGDPHYELAPMLWNRWEEAVETGDLREAVRRRFFLLVDHAELDEERARDWVIVREVHNALWAVQDAERSRSALDAEDREWITSCVAIAKAVQD
jgi:streptomycin 6-kinase